MLAISPNGALGTVAPIADEARNIPLGMLLGVGTLAAIALGVWLIRQGREIRSLLLPLGVPSPERQ